MFVSHFYHYEYKFVTRAYGRGYILRLGPIVAVLVVARCGLKTQHSHFIVFMHHIG